MALRSCTGVVSSVGAGGSLGLTAVRDTVPPSIDSRNLKTPTSRSMARTVSSTRPMPSLLIANALMSACSWRLSGCDKSGRRWLFSAMFEDLLQLRIVDGHQGTLLQL